MKILVTIILALFLTIETSFAQVFPNLGLSQVSSTCLNGRDQLGKLQSDVCSASPWFASHGTPDILSNRFVFVGSGINADNGNAKESEGVSYRQTFLKGKLYIMDISFSTNTTSFNIYLANGVPISNQGVNTPANPTNRVFSVPNVSDKQVVLQQGSTNSTLVTKTISFIPEKDYECLWFFSEDNNNVSNGGLNEALFKVNSLTCDIEPIKAITSTDSKFDYGARGDGYSFHIPMQSITATDRINIIPQNFVYSLPYVRTIPYPKRDPKVKLVAGRSILIKPDNNARSSFSAVRGSIFSAKISNNIGCEDACEGYLPWYEGCCGLKAPLLVNKCDNAPAFTEFRLVSDYPKSYNAYRVEMIVYRSGTDITFPIFTQIWEDPQKRSLPEACVVWKPGSLDYGNYNVYIKLTNCHGDHVMTNGDGTRPDVTVVCGSPFPDDVGQLSNKDLNKSSISDNAIRSLRESYIIPSDDLIKYKAKGKISVIVSPNPTTGVIRIQSDSDIGISTIRVTNMLGMDIEEFHNDYILKNNLYEYDASSFPTGMYIISIISDNKVISRTKINKL